MKLVSNAGVYADSGTCIWHFDQLNDHTYTFKQENYYRGSEQLEPFLQSNHQYKIASFHVPFPETSTWLERFQLTYNQVDHTFVFCSELHEFTVDQLLTLDYKNVSIFVCGIINQTFEHARIYQWMDWFVTTTHFYCVHQPTLLEDKLLPQQNKPKKFDILLGAQRQHRDYVNNYIIEKNLTDQVVMSYFYRIDQSLQDNPKFIQETEGVEYIPGRKLTHSIDSILYYGQEKSLSQVVPISVYNQTYYTVVAETNFWNHFNFYTEKTVKPLMAGRLFVGIAGQHYLANLRRLGFQTFSNVIDESYDLEPDPEIRWQMAMQQVEYLCTADPAEIILKIKDAVEHNRRLILEYDWYYKFSLEFAAVIAGIIEDSQDS
jgi:hypothetical protein